MTPEDIHALTSIAWDYVMLHGKGKLRRPIEFWFKSADLEMGQLA